MEEKRIVCGRSTASERLSSWSLHCMSAYGKRKAVHREKGGYDEIWDRSENLACGMDAVCTWTGLHAERVSLSSVDPHGMWRCLFLSWFATEEDALRKTSVVLIVTRSH